MVSRAPAAGTQRDMASQQAAERWLARAAATPRSPTASRSSRGTTLDDRTPRSLYVSEVRHRRFRSLARCRESSVAAARFPAPLPPRVCADAAASWLQRDENAAPGASGLGGFAGAARAAPSRYGPDSGAAPLRSEGGSPERFFSRGNEKLYEAFQQLHTMAQDFDKPFDSPAILVVGHQTDGKSGALAQRRCAAPVFN